MGIRSWIVGLQQRAVALTRQGTYYIGDRMSGLYQWFNPGPSVAKVSVDENSCLTISAVFAAVRSVMNAVGGATINVYSLEGNAKRKRPDLPLYDLLDVEPNEEMSSRDFFSVLVGQGMLYGNAYAEIVRDGSGRPLEIWPIHNRDVQLRRDRTGRLYYEYLGSTPIPAADIIHVKGVLAHSGVLGEMTTRLAKDSYALSKATELYGAAFFGNGSRPGLVIEQEKDGFGSGPKAEEARRGFLDSIKLLHGGVLNANNNAMLPPGMRLKTLDVDNNAFQFLETRMLQIEECCRWTGVPPHIISHLVKTSFNTIEALSLDFVHRSVLPWIEAIEGELRRKLLTREQRKLYDIKFDFRRLLQRDAKSQAEVHAIYLQNGVMNLDEVRDDLDRNPLPDGQGEKHYVSLNYGPIDEQKEEPEVSPPSDPSVPPAPTEQSPSEDEDEEEETDVRALVEPFRAVIESEVSRILRVETDKVTRAATKGGVAALKESFYSKHPDHVRSSLARVIKPLAGVLRAVGQEIDLTPIVATVAEQMVEASVSDLADEEGLTQRVEEWVDARTPMIADELLSAVVESAGANVGV